MENKINVRLRGPDERREGDGHVEPQDTFLGGYIAMEDNHSRQGIRHYAI